VKKRTVVLNGKRIIKKHKLFTSLFSMFFFSAEWAEIWAVSRVIWALIVLLWDETRFSRVLPPCTFLFMAWSFAQWRRNSFFR